MAFEIRSEILAQIGKTQDDHMRVVLLLLLGVLEAGAEEVQKVGKKIDALRNDEDALRRAVLNGHASTHHDDHVWISEHRQLSQANQGLIDEARPLMAWVQQQMEYEQEARANRKTFLQKIAEGAANQIGTILVTALVTWATLTHLK